MTGYVIRFVREGRVCNIDIDELDDLELERWRRQQSLSGQDGFEWAVALAKWIRDNVHAQAQQTEEPSMN